MNFKLIILLFSMSTFASSKQWVYKKLDGKKIPALWKEAKVENIVAVIDTGIDTQHEDLRDNLWINQIEKDGLPGVDDDGNGYIDDIHGFNFVDKTNDLSDKIGHGTHVAGVIGATHNKKGIKGVNPLARIMTLKAFSEKTSDVEFSVEAIYYAVDNGAKVINCSWIEYKHSPELDTAIDYAKANNVIVVGAAGNEGKDLTLRRRYLMEYESVIRVANISSNGRLAQRSNYSKTKVDIAAPGSTIYSTVPGSKYQYKSGTSMAAPFVSGAISLLFSIYPDFESSLVKDRIMATGKKKGHYNRKIKSKKRINVYNFIKDIR